MTQPRNLFIFALRRSGTTAIWRVLRENPGWTCFDEPMSPLLERLPKNNHKQTWDELIALHDLDPVAWRESFAPIARREELTPDLTLAQSAYFNRLVAQAPMVLDETRMVAKLPVVAQLCPEAVVLHLFRHPVAFVSSHMIASQNTAPMRRILHRLAFFRRWFYFDSWGMEQHFSPALLPTTRALLIQEGVDLPGRFAPAIAKLMAIWLASFRRVERDGALQFGDKFLSLSFEDFCEAPQHHLEALHDLCEAPHFTYDTETLHSPHTGYWAHDPRWIETAIQVGFNSAECARFFPQNVARQL